jgi:uncharacterized protein YneF (UPF0154 family)
MSNTKLKHSNKNDGVKFFLITIILSIIIGFFVAPNKSTEKFNYQNSPLEEFQLKNNTVSFYVKSLGNKKFEIPVNQEITQDSKLFLAYKVKDDKLTDLQSVSHNGKVIWTNQN